MLCTFVVYMCCVHVRVKLHTQVVCRKSVLLCTCVVYICCVHVLCTCVVYMCCVHVLCTCACKIAHTSRMSEIGPEAEDSSINDEKSPRALAPLSPVKSHLFVRCREGCVTSKGGNAGVQHVASKCTGCTVVYPQRSTPQPKHVTHPAADSVPPSLNDRAREEPNSLLGVNGLWLSVIIKCDGFLPHALEWKAMFILIYLQEEEILDLLEQCEADENDSAEYRGNRAYSRGPKVRSVDTCDLCHHQFTIIIFGDVIDVFCLT